MSAPSLSSRYRTAFVTGASSGLGLAFTQMLLAEGVQVWGTSRDARRLPVRENFHPVTLELGDAAAAEAGYREASRAAGGFDLVINNAGFGVFGAFAQTEFSAWERQLQIMLLTTARLSHLALRDFQARGRGALVNVSSLAVEFALPYQSAYNMAKAGLSALNESLMYEVRGSDVIVIDLRPGDYRTDFEGSVLRPTPTDAAAAPAANANARADRAWAAFAAMMRAGPAPAGAAKSLRRALAHGRSGTVRTGRFFQTVIAPFLVRFGSQGLKRRIQEMYFGL